MANCYINGQHAATSQALAIIAAAADAAGYESENWMPAWNRRAQSEEAREFLNEISGYVVEIVQD